MKRRTFVLAAVPVLVVGAVAVYLRPIAPIATGYAAKTICSGHFISERTIGDVTGDLPANPLVPFLRTSFDDDAGTVTTTLLGRAGSTARFTDGAGCALADAPPSAVPPVSPSDPWSEDPSPAIEQAIAQAFDEPDDPDLVRGTRALVVVHGGDIVAERYADGFDAATPLLGWSMGKSLTNAMVGRLVASGDLDLADDHLVAAWEDDDRSAITLGELMQMSSGLAFEEVYDPGTDATKMLYTPQDTGAFAAAQPLAAPPGTLFNYSSGTTNIICDIALGAAGGDASLMRDLVFEPIGMSSAIMEQDASGGLVCSSFPYATARDWARFGQWFLQDGEWEGQQLLPADWVTYSTTPVQIEAEAPYGAQWWLNSDRRGEVRMPRVPEDAYWASGNEGQQVAIIPSADLVVVRLGLSSGYSGVDWGLEDVLADVLAALP